MLMTFLLSLVLRFGTTCFGCHQLEPDLGVSQQVSTIFPSKPALCSIWSCLPHPEVEFHARLVTFLSSLVLRFSNSCYGCHQLAPDPRVPPQVSSIYPSKPAICSYDRREAMMERLVSEYRSALAFRDQRAEDAKGDRGGR